MERMEWKLADRSEWRRGPWDSEPDKVQFPDEATGLPCLIVRNPSGALCGYVGVGPTHPWYRVVYSKCPTACEKSESYCRHSPDARVSVHGGLTFSDACHDASPERYAEFRERWAERLPHTMAEAEKFPQGDSANRLRRWGPLVDDFDKWREHVEGTSICHLAGPGDFEPAWWFGFDCNHSGDSTPRKRDYDFDYGGTYKRVEYVRQECQKLAAQLAEIS